MNQILASVCCPSQNEHIEINNVANSHVGVILKRRQNAQKFIIFFFFFIIFFVTLFCPGSFAATTMDTKKCNILLEPL